MSQPDTHGRPGSVPLHLDILPLRLAVCRLGPDDPVPARPPTAAFWSVTQTPEETSLVVPEEHVHPAWRAERGWRCLRVRGPLPFEMVGVLHALSAPLARAGISLFVLSTYDTDYILVRERDLGRARAALVAVGHCISEDPETASPEAQPCGE